MRRPVTQVFLFTQIFLLFLALFSPSSTEAQNSTSTTTGEVGGRDASAVKVGVILDLGNSVGKMSRLCMEMAASDFYAAHPGYATRLLLRVRDSKRDAVDAAAAAVDLLKNERVQAIIGPQTSEEAEFVVDLGNKAQVPVVSFTATSPSLSQEKTRFFVRTALDDSSQAQSIAALVTAFGWKQVVPIYESEYGEGGMPYLVDAIKGADARVPYRCVLPPMATDDHILLELYKLLNMESRTFLVHMRRGLASRLFAKANEVGMMSQGFAWIITEGVTSLLGNMDPSVVHDSMQGVLGVKPHVHKSERLQQFTRRWPREFLKENPESEIFELSVFGLWAYDTVWAMAMAVERIGASDLGFRRAPETAANSTDLGALGVSETGPRLLDSILNTQFAGLSGWFHLVDGQLHAPAFEVVNVIGQKERVLGFWTPKNGLMRHLNLSSEKSYSASMDDLAPVIWPGDSTVVPKGWVEPTIGKKLKVLVPGPVLPGFHSFLRAEIDPTTKETVVGGFVIEVFEAAVKELPYAVLFEYITLQRDGNSVGNYNYLVQLINEQKYDALVGDVTITANRSDYVDFTLPYTASGVSMVVPYRDDRSRNAWIFLKPLTANLWLVSLAFFVFTGAVVWILEHPVNEDFRGPPSHQWGTVFYFIFSTLVFSHKEKMVSNLSRVVVIIWVFVVLILQSSYTASLTSMLTVKHLRPTVADFQELLTRGENVGYLKNSFTKGMLTKKGFNEKNLKPYRSPQEYREALSNGSVAAVVDEIPYLKVFLKDYCANYTMAGRTYKTGGFGFAFPRGSPLAQDLSRAILNITEGDKMVEIERRWFGDQSNCPDKDSNLTSDSLNLASFWGLFLITGVASVGSFLAFLFSFVYQHRHVLRDSGSGNSLWSRVSAVSRHYDQKDLSSYTFRKEAKDEVGTNHGDVMASPCTNRTAATGDTVASSPFTDKSDHGDTTASPPTNGSESPFSMHNQTIGGTPPPEPGSPIPEVATTTVELAGAAEEEITPTEFARTAYETRVAFVEMSSIGSGR